jgi:hypothetical protein
MRYRSKPHTIEAFQFTLENLKQTTIPKWFDDALKDNRAQITINSKDQYICLYSPDGGVRKAYIDDYICLNSVGIIFPLPEEEFEKDFELDDVCQDNS